MVDNRLHGQGRCLRTVRVVHGEGRSGGFYTGAESDVDYVCDPWLIQDFMS